MSAKDSLQDFIRWVMRDVTYHKHYSATVQGQTGDTVAILPDDEEMKANGLINVPIDQGLPGVKATVASGTPCTLYFENGDPQKPRAKWVGGSHISLSFADGVMPLARVGDSVSISGVMPGTGAAIGIISSGAPTVKA